MKDLRKFVNERLAAMHARPAMWAGTKEAFALQVVLLVEIATDENFNTNQFLTKLFPGTNKLPSETFDVAWAHKIVKIARQELMLE